MNNKVKKMLLVLGMVASVATPLSTIISCDNSKKEKAQKDEKGKDDANDEKGKDDANDEKRKAPEEKVIEVGTIKKYSTKEIIKKLKEDEILKEDFDLKTSLKSKEGKAYALTQLLKAIKDDKDYIYISQLFADHIEELKIVPKGMAQTIISSLFGSDLAKVIINNLLIRNNKVSEIVQSIFGGKSIDYLGLIKKVIENSDYPESIKVLQRLKDMIENLGGLDLIFELGPFKKYKEKRTNIICWLKNGIEDWRDSDSYKMKAQKLIKKIELIIDLDEKSIIRSALPTILQIIDGIDKNILPLLWKGINNSSAQDIAKAIDSLHIFIKNIIDIMDKKEIHTEIGFLINNIITLVKGLDFDIDKYIEQYKPIIKKIEKYLEALLSEKKKIDITNDYKNTWNQVLLKKLKNLFNGMQPIMEVIEKFELEQKNIKEIKLKQKNKNFIDQLKQSIMNKLNETKKMEEKNPIFSLPKQWEKDNYWKNILSKDTKITEDEYKKFLNWWKEQIKNNEQLKEFFEYVENKTLTKKEVLKLKLKDIKNKILKEIPNFDEYITRLSSPDFWKQEVYSTKENDNKTLKLVKLIKLIIGDSPKK